MTVTLNPARQADKKAILVVSFGTSYAETREKTIGATERRIAEAYPTYTVRRAFTSEVIIRKMKERDGIQTDTPVEALDRLHREGYSHVVVQPLHLISGYEYHDILRETHPYRKAFDSFRIGKPLLDTAEDYIETVRSVAAALPKLQEGEAALLMGHGTHHGANAAYPALDYTFKQQGFPHIHVGTVEGFPELPEVMALIESRNYRKLWLFPLMLVAGDHALNDMAGDEEDSWKSILEAAGYETEPLVVGLGELEAIQAIYLRHVEAALEA